MFEIAILLYFVVVASIDKELKGSIKFLYFWSSLHTFSYFLYSTSKKYEMKLCSREKQNNEKLMNVNGINFPYFHNWVLILLLFLFVISNKFTSTVFMSIFTDLMNFQRNVEKNRIFRLNLSLFEICDAICLHNLINILIL